MTYFTETVCVVLLFLAAVVLYCMLVQRRKFVLFMFCSPLEKHKLSHSRFLSTCFLLWKVKKQYQTIEAALGKEAVKISNKRSSFMCTRVRTRIMVQWGAHHAWAKSSKYPTKQNKKWHLMPLLLVAYYHTFSASCSPFCICYDDLTCCT